MERDIDYRLCVVVPAYNEQDVLPEFHRRLAAVLDTHAPNGDPLRSTRSAFAVMNSAPNRSACARMLVMSSGPMMPSGNQGKFST